jgi:cbb3-type cytochrome oxidase subunit 3
MEVIHTAVVLLFSSFLFFFFIFFIFYFYFFYNINVNSMIDFHNNISNILLNNIILKKKKYHTADLEKWNGHFV